LKAKRADAQRLLQNAARVSYGVPTPETEAAKAELRKTTQAEMLWVKQMIDSNPTISSDPGFAEVVENLLAADEALNTDANTDEDEAILQKAETGE
jgi:hypothetical protein